MKGRTLSHLFLLALFVTTTVGSSAAKTVVLEFFFHPDCTPCKEPKQLLEELQLEYAQYLVVEWRDMKYKDAMEKFLDYELSRRPSVVFNHDPDTAVYDLKEENLRAKIEYYLETSENRTQVNDGSDSEHPDRTLYVTLPLVIVSGLIDGINPCAFSLLIFFISFLFSIKRTRQSIFGWGLTYIAGIFAGYIGIGLGLFHTVSILGVKHLFGLLGTILLVVLGILHLRDAFTTKKPLLRVPKFWVPTFEELTKKTSYPLTLILGVLVSFFEFPCSGGVYVGILVLLSSRMRFYEGVFYLITYNFMFVFPLILILLLSFNTDVLLKMDKWNILNRRARERKLIIGFLLIFLAIFTWFIVLK